MYREGIPISTPGRRNHHPLRPRLRREKHHQLQGRVGERRRVFLPGRIDRGSQRQVRPRPATDETTDPERHGDRRTTFRRRDADRDQPG